MQTPSQASSLPNPAAPVSSSRIRRDRRSEAIDAWCERGILGLVLVILVFGPIGFGAVDPGPQLVIQGLTLGVMILWMARVWLSKSYRIIWPPICWAVALFLVYAGVRYRVLVAEGGVEYLARQEVLLVAIYGCLFFAVLNNLSRQESVQIISMTLLALGTILSLYALYQFITKSGKVLWVPQYRSYIGRASGTYMCPNHLAGLLEMLLPLGLALTLTGRFKPTAKVFLGYASLALFVGIAVTLSRGAWASTGIALLLFFGLLMRRHGQRLAGIIFFVLLLAGFIFFIKNLGALQRRINVVLNESRIDGTRFQLWKPAVQMWRDNPWLGVGPAHFDVRFRGYRPDDIQMRPLYAHNDYLNSLADWGLVGTLAMGGAVGLLYLGILQSWKYVKRANDLGAKQSNRTAFVLGAGIGLLAMLVHSVVDFNMHIPANAILAVVLMALITGHLRFATERYWFKLSWIGKPILTLMCLAAVAFLAAQGVRRTGEYLFREHAARARDLESKLKWLKAAYAVEPKNSEITYELGETLRLASWQGVGNYRELATEAISWFQRGMELNRFDPYNPARLGMCYHWLGDASKAEPLFQQAVALDPKNYYIQFLMGWHFLEAGNLPQAKAWFEKSVFQAHWHPDYKFTKYQSGLFYLNIVTNRMAEGAKKEASRE